MPDNLFDNFVNGKLNDHEAPVPNGLWDKITEQQFDEFIGSKLNSHEAPVSDGLWDKVTDGQLDNFFANTLRNYTAPVPDGVWGRIGDAQLDHFFADKLDQYIAPVPADAFDSIDDRQFDHYFASRLTDHVAPVPEGLWEKIHPEEEEDRRIIAWWRLPVAASLLLFVLLGGAMGAYFLFKPHTETASVVTAKDKESHTKDHAATPVIVPGAKDATSSSTPGTHSNTTSLQPDAQPSGVNSNKENTTANPLPAQRSTLTPLSNNVDQNTTTASSAANHPRAHNDIGLNNGGHHTPFVPSQLAGDVKKENGLPPATNDNNDKITTNALPVYRAAFNPGMTVPTPFDRKRYGWDLSGLQLADNKHASKFKSNIICPTNRSNSNTDWLLEAYVSPDVAFRSLSGSTASTQYLQKKDSSEQMRVGFTAGIRIVKPITDNIWLKTGVQYTQMNERYAYRTENEIKTTTVVTVRTIIRAPGDTVVVSDTSTLQTVGFKNNTIKNRYRSIDIPLTVGYQFGNPNDDIRIGVNAGVIFNISSWYQGVILDSTLSVVELTKSNNMVYKSKLGLGLYAGISVTKQLGEDMQLFFEPYFRYNLSNMTTSQAGYNQRFSLGGLSVGLRFNLNR